MKMYSTVCVHCLGERKNDVHAYITDESLFGGWLDYRLASGPLTGLVYTLSNTMLC